MSAEIRAAIDRLNAQRGNLTRQQFLTLRGQILAGDPEGAEKGLEKIIKRGEKHGAQKR